MKKSNNCGFWIYLGVAVIAMFAVPFVLGIPKTPEDRQGWADIGAVEAALATIIGIPFVAYQVYCARLALGSQAIAAAYTPFVQLDQFFFEHHELRPFIYCREDEPHAIPKTPKKYNPEQIESLAEIVTDTLYQAFCQKEAIGIETFGPETEYLRSLFNGSRLLQDFLRKKRTWYKDEFIALVMPSLLKNPPVPAPAPRSDA